MKTLKSDGLFHPPLSIMLIHQTILSRPIGFLAKPIMFTNHYVDLVLIKDFITYLIRII